MNVEEIKKAMEEGEEVCWVNKGYKVIKDEIGQYFIMCMHNEYCIGLTWRDGKTLNGREEQFFINRIF